MGTGTAPSAAGLAQGGQEGLHGPSCLRGRRRGYGRTSTGSLDTCSLGEGHRPPGGAPVKPAPGRCAASAGTWRPYCLVSAEAKPT